MVLTKNIIRNNIIKKEMQIYKLLIYFLYNVIITFFLVITYFNCFYRDLELIPYYFSFYLFGNFTIYNIFKNKKIITLQNGFNVFGFLYSNFYITQMIYSNSKIDTNYYWAMFLSYISIFAFNVFYLFTKKNIKFYFVNKYSTMSNNNINSFIFILFILLFFCISIEYYVLFKKIGIVNYLVASRASKSLLLAPYSRLSFYKMIIPLISIVSLLIYIKFKIRKSKTIFIIAFFLTLFDSIISASRSELISVLLPIFYMLEKYNIITKKVLLIIAISTFLLFGIWKSLLRSSHVELYYDSEFNTWYKICNKVLNSNIPLQFGKSYLDTLINTVVPFTNSEPLSRWYLKRFEYSTLEKGGGRGFSGVLEAFMNWGYLGNILVFGFYGFLLKQIQMKTYKNNDFFEIIYMIFLVSLFQFYRSESYSLWKNMVWFRIYPVIFIFYFSKLKICKLKTK